VRAWPQENRLSEAMRGAVARISNRAPLGARIAPWKGAFPFRLRGVDGSVEVQYGPQRRSGAVGLRRARAAVADTIAQYVRVPLGDSAEVISAARANVDAAPVLHRRMALPPRVSSLATVGTPPT
jgi:hypothetical protein